MRPALRDKASGEWISGENEHPLLKLLENPGSGQSALEFRFELMTSYCATGACYPVALGNVRFEPVGLYSVGAEYAQLQEGGDGWLGDIYMSASYDQSRYERQIIPKRPWVYQRESGLAETIQIRNSIRRHSIYPQSVLDRVYYQAVSKYYGNQHNAAILKNGSRPGGIWSPKEGSLTQDNYEAFRGEVEKMTGPQAAGANIVAPVPIDYENLMVTSRDMDFIKLIENSRVEIYSQYQIPLPLVVTRTMTMANFENAVIAFYDMAVLPRAKFVLKTMGNWLLSRYKDGDKYELTINEKELDALKGRMIERQKNMVETRVYSRNETRAEAGYESIGPEGDIIYGLATEIPIGEDDDTRL
jgi:HK97 family phage portal protein